MTIWRPSHPSRAERLGVALTCLLAALVHPRISLAADPPPPPPPAAAAKQEKLRQPPADLLKALRGTRGIGRQLHNQAEIEAARATLNKTADLLKQLPPSAQHLPLVEQARQALLTADKSLKDLADATGTRGINEQNLAPLARTANSDMQAVADSTDTVADIIRRTYGPSRAIVVSGGVSLGSYQAGFLYYYGLSLRYYDRWLGGDSSDWANDHFQVATGASAGSINSLLAAVTGCLEPELDPEQSLFFNTWISVGLDGLISNHPTPTSDGLFSESAIEHGPLGMVADLWGNPQKHHWRKGPCEAQLGFTATRLSPRRVDIAFEQVRTTREQHDKNVLSLDRMTEKFLLSMKGDGGAPPRFVTKRLPKINQQVYPTLGDGSGSPSPDGLAVTPAQMIQLLRASSAFLVAFAPKKLDLSTWTPDGSRFNVEVEQKTPFSDGGFLDNTPLRIAQKLLGAEAKPAAPDDALPEPRVLLLMSGAQTWKKPPPPTSPTDDEKSVLGRYLPFVFNFLNTASDGGLIDVFEDADGAFKYDIPMRDFPIAADPLGHFFAFAERDFRVFDFYQGMVDAEELVGGEIAPGHSTIPFTSTSSPFECFRDYRRRLRAARRTVPPLGEACAQTEDNLRALLQASARRRITATPGDDDLEEFVKVLKQYHYKYRDLANDRELDMTGVGLALRERFDRLGSPFAGAQPDRVSKLGVAAIAPVATDLWWYRARTYLALGLPGDSSLQAVFSVPFRRWRSFSVRGAVEAFVPFLPRTLTYVTDQGTTHLSALPFQAGAGLAGEVEIKSGLQLEVGVNGVVRSELLWSPRDVPFVLKGIEPYTTLALGERIYINLSGSYFFGGCAGDNRCAAVKDKYASFVPALVSPGPFSDDLMVRVSLGWRFLW